MSISTGTLIRRLPGISPSEFRTRYDSHMSLIVSLFGHLFPLSNTRHFVSQDRSALTQSGVQASPDFDCYTVNVFEDQLHLDRFLQRYREVFHIIDDDERRFIDKQSMQSSFLAVDQLTRESAQSDVLTAPQEHSE